jgi:prevent-host-death family protein
MAIKVGALEAKNRFSELVETVAHTKQRFLVERRGKPMAAIVAVADLTRLESLEGIDDIEIRKQELDAWLTEADRIRNMVEAHLQGRALSSAADLLREAREDRMV